MRISLIAAIGKNRELGKNNNLLWHIPEDLKHFKKITQGHAVIMGRKTYESIGGPLPNRTNIIVTRNPSFQASNCLIVKSIDEAIQKAQSAGETEAFIIGGGQIYQESLTIADKLYLTVVNASFEADTFFPEYKNIFTKKTFEEKHQSADYSYTFLELERGDTWKVI